MLTSKHIYHVIASLTNSVIGYVLSTLPLELRDILIHLLNVIPTQRWSIDRITVSLYIYLYIYI